MRRFFDMEISIKQKEPVSDFSTTSAHSTLTSDMSVEFPLEFHLIDLGVIHAGYENRITSMYRGITFCMLFIKSCRDHPHRR